MPRLAHMIKRERNPRPARAQDPESALEFAVVSTDLNWLRPWAWVMEIGEGNGEKPRRGYEPKKTDTNNTWYYVWAPMLQ